MTSGPGMSEIGLICLEPSSVFIEKISKETGRFLERIRNVVANPKMNLECGCF